MSALHEHRWSPSGRFCETCGATAEMVANRLVEPTPLTPAELRRKRRLIAASDKRQGFA